MPTNASPLYYLAEERYLNAETRDEKIAALEEMIRELPKHKGTENVQAQLKRKLAKLKAQSGKRKTAKGEGIEKAGDAQLCVIGETNSGKSSLLKYLTGKNIRIGDKKYTTTKPEVAIFNFDGAKIQMIEIPSLFENAHMSLLTTCNLVLCLYTNTKEKKKIGDLLKRRRVLSKTIFVLSKSDLNKEKAHMKFSIQSGEGIEELKNLIWKKLGLIRIYTKANNKVEKNPIVLKKGSTIKTLAIEIHKDLFTDFNFARIFDNTQFSGKRVGLKYKLKEGDIVEIHRG